jgi:hypothetical protein
MRSVLLIAILSSAASSQNAIPQKHAETVHTQKQTENRYIEAPCPNKDGNAQAKVPTSEHPPPKWWQRPTITDWILATTTVCYLGVNVFILLAIKRQNDAVMNAERPWILVSKTTLDSEFIRHSDDEPAAGSRQHFVVKFTITNAGKTPAIIRGIEGGIEILDDLGHPFQILDHSWKGQARRILGPSQDDTIWFITHEAVTKEDNVMIYNSENITRKLLAFGNIEYTDTFDRKHISKFCFLYKDTMDGFRYFCHNPTHNQYT